MKNARGFYWYIVRVVICFALLVAATFWLKAHVTLIHVVTLGKLFSLVLLLLVNGEIAKEVDKEQPDIKWANYALLIVVFALALLTAAKFLEVDLGSARIADAAKHIIVFLQENVIWLAAIPIIGYALLDAHIAYLRNSTTHDREVALKFLVFVDVVSVLPLLLVYTFAAVQSRAEAPSPVEVESFLNGSMAVVLLSSAIATKAVEHYFD